MRGIKPKSKRSNYYGASVQNDSDNYVPEHILELAVKLRQAILDSGLDMFITVDSRPNTQSTNQE